MTHINYNVIGITSCYAMFNYTFHKNNGSAKTFHKNNGSAKTFHKNNGSAKNEVAFHYRRVSGLYFLVVILRRL